MNFEEYLISKKIDSRIFREAEPSIWEEWKGEFEAMHPASFTAQKLYLINPIRRKYQLTIVEQPKTAAVQPKSEADQMQPTNEATTQNSSGSQPPVKPAVSRPVFKPKPKI